MQSDESDFYDTLPVLDDFAEAVKYPINGYHKIEFEEDPHEIYLDAKQVEADSEEVKNVYSLPELKHL